jgi:hypothetical protein
MFSSLEGATLDKQSTLAVFVGHIIEAINVLNLARRRWPYQICVEQHQDECVGCTSVTWHLFYDYMHSDWLIRKWAYNSVSTGLRIARGLSHSGPIYTTLLQRSRTRRRDGVPWIYSGHRLTSRALLPHSHFRLSRNYESVSAETENTLLQWFRHRKRNSSSR